MPEIRNIQVKTSDAYNHLSHAKQSLRFNSIKVATTVNNQNGGQLRNGVQNRQAPGGGGSQGRAAGAFVAPTHMPPIPPTLKRTANFSNFQVNSQRTVKKRVQIKLPPRVMTIKKPADIR